MSDADQPFYVFEHPAFTDAFDAQRQSRLYGFRYTTDHAKYGALCDALRARLSPEVLAASLGTPLEKVPDNTPLYILRLTPEARGTVLPVLLEEAVALGFSVLDDMQGRCHCPAGLWTIDGLQPAASA
ncbi:hypothetical protein ACQQ2N_03065 [Dokdonella sp. MW10]|uniref:hypothetical protein n=1 Tax=Dokdonella sp. MW10 TaxID=2992926 RepID=UPI003F817CE5